MRNRFHRQGDKRIERAEAEVFWAPAYQSYFSAGEEAEPYCSNCDELLETGWRYCAFCGDKLYTLRDVDDKQYKEYGVG